MMAMDPPTGRRRHARLECPAAPLAPTTTLPTPQPPGPVLLALLLLVLPLAHCASHLPLQRLRGPGRQLAARRGAATCPSGSSVRRVEGVMTCKCSKRGAHWVGGKCRVGGLSHSEWLDGHNNVRAVLRLPSLKWDGKVAKKALAWADRLTEIGCKVKTDTRKWLKLGDNCHKFYRIGWNETGLATEAVDEWVAQGGDYKRATFPDGCQKGKSCKAYTQVVWRETTSVGCGIAHCVGGNGIICCKYAPMGNKNGKVPY